MGSDRRGVRPRGFSKESRFCTLLFHPEFLQVLGLRWS